MRLLVSVAALCLAPGLRCETRPLASQIHAKQLECEGFVPVGGCGPATTVKRAQLRDYGVVIYRDEFLLWRPDVATPWFTVAGPAWIVACGANYAVHPSPDPPCRTAPAIRLR